MLTRAMIITIHHSVPTENCRLIFDIADGRLSPSIIEGEVGRKRRGSDGALTSGRVRWAAPRTDAMLTVSLHMLPLPPTPSASL